MLDKKYRSSLIEEMASLRSRPRCGRGSRDKIPDAEHVCPLVTESTPMWLRAGIGFRDQIMNKTQRVTFDAGSSLMRL